MRKIHRVIRWPLREEAQEALQKFLIIQRDTLEVRPSVYVHQSTRQRQKHYKKHEYAIVQPEK